MQVSSGVPRTAPVVEICQVLNGYYTERAEGSPSEPQEAGKMAIWAMMNKSSQGNSSFRLKCLGHSKDLESRDTQRDVQENS